MGAVHTLVAEVARELIHTVETTHDQTLQIKLVGDTEVEGHVEGVVMGDERTSRGATGDCLEHGGLHLKIAVRVEILAHGVIHLSALQEDFAHAGIDHKIDIAATVAHLGISEGVVGFSILHLHDGEGAEALAEHGEFLSVD